MNAEENRLRTFTGWPSDAAVEPARVARAGFYYTGVGTAVQCFLCGERILEWNYGDQAMARHRAIAPDCPFVRNPTSTANVPLVASAGDPSSGGAAPRRGSAGAAPATGTTVPPAESSSPNPKVEYATRARRLRSFADWPIPSVVAPERLAESGFFYTQLSDAVECVFCGGVVMHWEAGDDPDEEHRTHFPSCDFLVRRAHEDDNDDDDEAPSARLAEMGNVKLAPGGDSAIDLGELGIRAHTAPRHPKYTSYEGRLRTFEGWPENLKQTPEMLADAGFYYVGSRDQVRCFYCDGGLRNWEETDDAWTEHARWFAKCGFVSLVRGREFVERCIENRPPLDPSIFAGVSEEEEEESGEANVNETRPAHLRGTSPPRRREVTDTELQQLLTTAPAATALEIGLPVGRVKMALKRRMEETGVPYAQADQLIEDALRVQHEEEDRAARQDGRTPDSPSSELTALMNEMITAESPNASRGEGTRPENRDAAERRAEDVRRERAEAARVERETKSECRNEPRKGKNEEPEAESLSLEEENRRLKEARLCKICMDREVAIVFLPCGHLATCVHCAPSLKHCPMCRQEIRATVRTFLS